MWRQISHWIRTTAGSALRGPRQRPEVGHQRRMVREPRPRRTLQNLDLLDRKPALINPVKLQPGKETREGPRGARASLRCLR